MVKPRFRDAAPVVLFAGALTLALVGVAGALVVRAALGARGVGASGLDEAWPAATRVITHTPLPTDTPTATMTPTATTTQTLAPATATKTLTPTRTATGAPTRTATPAATRTASPTRTATPAATRTAPATPTWTPVSEATSEATPTSAFPLVCVRTTGLNANLRAGPGLDYPVVATAPDGEQLLVRARAGDWFQVETPDRATAWVWSGLVEAVSDLGDVPALAIPTRGAPPQ